MKFAVALLAAMVTTSANARSLMRPLILKDSINSFGMDTLQKRLQENPDENVVYSPISAHLALGMLLNAGQGETANEIAGALDLPTSNVTALNAQVSKLMEDLNSRPQGELKLSLANGLWTKPTFKVKPAYVTEMKNSFRAEVDALNSADQINSWADKKTNGLIKKVIEDDVVAGLEMLLANATYFKADWSNPFDKAYPGQFTGLSGKAQAQIMNNKGMYNYAQGEDYQAIELPYGPKELASMIVVLPAEGQSISAYNQKLSAEWLKGVEVALNKRGQKSKGLVSMPKFDFKNEWKMNDALQALGMVDAFAGGANFKNMSDDTNLRVSFVKQDAVIKVDEKGTEAAAVTSIGVETTSVPNYDFILNVNRPFYYFIRDNQSGVILFAGLVVKP